MLCFDLLQGRRCVCDLACSFLTKRVGYLFSFLVPEHGGWDMNSPYNFDFAISVCAV